MEIEAVDIDFSYRLKKLDIKEGCFFCPNNSCEDPTITRKKIINVHIAKRNYITIVIVVNV